MKTFVNKIRISKCRVKYKVYQRGIERVMTIIKQLGQAIDFQIQYSMINNCLRLGKTQSNLATCFLHHYTFGYKFVMFVKNLV